MYATEWTPNLRIFIMIDVRLSTKMLKQAQTLLEMDKLVLKRRVPLLNNDFLRCSGLISMKFRWKVKTTKKYRLCSFRMIMYTIFNKKHFSEWLAKAYEQNVPKYIFPYTYNVRQQNHAKEDRNTDKNSLQCKNAISWMNRVQDNNIESWNHAFHINGQRAFAIQLLRSFWVFLLKLF